MTLPDARARVRWYINHPDTDPDFAAALSRVLAELDRLPRLREALEKMKALRLHQLEQSCPDCDPGCTHGAKHDMLLARLTAALETPDG